MLNKIINLSLISWSIFFSPSQCLSQPLTELTLGQAYGYIENKFPSLDDRDIVTNLLSLELSKYDSELLPTISFGAEASLQSEAVHLDSDGLPPTVDFSQPLYSINSFVKAQYALYDGGRNEAKRSIARAISSVELKKLDITEYSLREVINRLFIKILLIREQATLFDLSLEDLSTREEVIRSGIEMGVLLESEITKLEVRRLELISQRDNLSFKLQGLIRILSNYTGQDLSKDLLITFPDMPDPLTVPDIARPELELFQSRREGILAQNQLVESNFKPLVYLGGQVGIGAPHPLNFVEHSISPYARVNVQFRMPLVDWNRENIEKEILQLEAEKIRNAEETFLFQLESRNADYTSEIERIRFQIEQDQNIARLQSEILKQLAVQLEEGVITSADYVIQVNAELAARQRIVIHETELLQTQLFFLTERGGIR